MGKKEDRLTPFEPMLDVYGNAWIWVAFAPVSRVVPAWLAGKCTSKEGEQLVKCLKNRLDEYALCALFTRDELAHYGDALLEVYSKTIDPPHTGKAGRTCQSYKVLPEDLLYAIVSNRRERNNLTIRQQARRMGRTVNDFSKDHEYPEHHLVLSFAYHHFVIPHGGLRQKLSRPIHSYRR